MKNFIDGSKYVGRDEDPNASWTRSRNDGLVSVEVHQANSRMIINAVGPSDFWMSDEYSVSFGDATPRLLHRRIQKRLDDCVDNFLAVRLVQNSELVVSLLRYPVPPDAPWDHFQPVLLSSKGKWLTLEMNVATGAFQITILDNRL